MRSTRRTIGWVWALIALGVAVGWTAHGTITAQTADPTPAYPLLLSGERAQAIAHAFEDHLGYVPGEVLVKFKNGTSVIAQQRALSSVRSRPEASDLRWVGNVAVLRDARESDAHILADELRLQPEVEYAEPNYLYKTTATPNDVGYSQFQWNFRAIDMPKAWDINAGGSSDLTVAVIDTGITTTTQSFVFQTWNGTAIQNLAVPFAVNPDFSASRMTGSRDLVFWTGPVLDMVGHGSHVAGTIGEDTNNNLAEAGIAYRTKLMPVKVCLGYWEIQFAMSAAGTTGYAPLDVGGCPNDAVAQGIQYAADNGATIINISLGGDQPSQTVQDAIKYAVSKGAFVAMAGGNSYEDGNVPEYPAAYAADIDGAMSVAAVGPSLTRAYYSTTGPQIEIAAPGGSDREGGLNGAIWQSTISLNDSDPARIVFPRFDRYAETPLEGTSMASPHVAGVAALIRSQGVTNPAVIEALIKKTARDLGAPGRDPEFGFGLIQPRAALFGFGIGR